MSFDEMWVKKSIKIGSICVPLIMLSMFLPLIYLKVAYGVFPEWNVALSAWAAIASIFGAFYIIEPFSYYPMLGLAGSYLGITCGSMSDIRVPAAVVAQSTLGVKSGSKEANIVTTLGVAGSVITTIVVVLLTVMLGSTVLSALPDSFVTGIQTYCVPAVLSAVFVQFSTFEPKLALLMIPAIIIFFLTTSVYTLGLVLAIVVSIICTRICYKMGFFKDKKAKTAEPEEE